MAKQMALPDFLTEAQIEQARAIYKEHDGTGRVAILIEEKVIRPNMKEINRKLGQENNSRYLAYCCEHVFNEVKRHGQSD